MRQFRVVAVLGASAVLMLAAFNVLLLAGAIYIAWIGFSILHNHPQLHVDAQIEKPNYYHSFRRGLLTAVLNPKAYLFLLAVFPQFLHPPRGRLWLQALVLWGIIATTQTGVYGAVALLGGKARSLFYSNPTATANVNRVVGVVLFLVAALTAYESWRAL